MSAPTVTLPSGDEMPVLGLGTWNIDGDTVREAVSAGLDAGYTHIDTAEGYMNEAEIGDALDAASVDRDDLFLTSKVLPKNLDYESVIDACQRSLDRLGTDYLDLYLIHWPNPAISLRETLDAMAHLHEEGLVRNIGVSNFSPYQLSTATHVSDVPIAVNQIEYHPWLQRPDWIEACREEDVVVEAAAPLARADVFDDDVVQDLAETYDRSPAQIVLRWAIQNDVVVIPKSSSPDHVRSNTDVLDWELDADDVARLNQQDRDTPVYDERHKNWDGDVWGIAE